MGIPGFVFNVSSFIKRCANGLNEEVARDVWLAIRASASSNSIMKFCKYTFYTWKTLHVI